MEWDVAVRVWLAGNVHCLACWVVPNGSCVFGLVQGLKRLSQGVLSKVGPGVSVLTALTERGRA